MRFVAPFSALALLATAAQAQITLEGSVETLSIATGGTQELTLQAGAANAGATYVVLGSASGSMPGIPFGGTTIPLNVDEFFTLSLTEAGGPIFEGTIGLLDAAGDGSANFNLPSGIAPALAGLELTFAYVLFEGAALNFAGVSNPTTVTLTNEVFAVENPEDGCEIVSPSFDVEGIVGDALSGTPGLAVTVNGMPAEVIPGTGGESDRFLFSNFEFSDTSAGGGLNVVVSNLMGDMETQALSISFAPFFTRNLDSTEETVFATRGGLGYAVVDLATRKATTFPAPGGSVDDLCLDGDLLFVLDASGAGSISVIDVSDPTAPQLLDGPRAVGVSPFAGVSAAAGRAVVSGGTGVLRVFTYSPAGILDLPTSTVDLGVGQPDVLVSSDGNLAFVSTDFGFPFPMGQSFGITTIGLFDPPTAPVTVARTGLPGAGFTPGGTGPANFAIESAELPGGQFVTAHGGGLSRMISATGALLGTIGLGFPAVNVDAVGPIVFVVGQNSLREVDCSGAAPVLGTTQNFGAEGPFVGVAASTEFVSMAGDLLRILRR